MKKIINTLQNKLKLKQEEKIEEKLNQLEKSNLIIPSYARAYAYDYLKKQTNSSGIIKKLDLHLKVIENKYKNHFHLVGKRTKNNLVNRINPHLQAIWDDCINMDFYLEIKISKKNLDNNLEYLNLISEKKEQYKEWTKDYQKFTQGIEKEIPSLESLCQVNYKLVELINLNIDKIEQNLENYLNLLKKDKKIKFN